jgi:hypothetical protein
MLSIRALVGTCTKVRFLFEASKVNRDSAGWRLALQQAGAGAQHAAPLVRTLFNTSRSDFSLFLAVWRRQAL